MDEYEIKHKSTDRYKQTKKILKKVFGYDEFKEHQYEIINNILDLNDVLGVMPTGYGKSLCFQIIPLLTNEMAIVVSPLIALMADQKMILDKLGIKSCCYNSSLTQKKKKEIEEGLVNNEYQIMYITPESLTLQSTMDLIEKVYEDKGICMVAIDEAHCISSYGFDFRPKYKEIVKIRKLLTNVPVLAVTATATDKVTNDIKKMMKMEKCVMIKTSFDRPNLMIHVRLQSSNVVNDIVSIISESKGPCIVYCLTKSDTETMAKKLTDSGIDSKAYHSGLKKDSRTKIQEEFMNDEYKCITATIAFGMGINKPDIRTVIHYGCPQNIESYYQEIGRAGRDGKPSQCYLFYKQRDFIIQRKFIDDIKDTTYKMVRTVLLHKISDYVNTGDCRRKLILSYFGQNVSKNNCGNCDNCTIKRKKIDKRDEYKLFQILGTINEISTTRGHTYGMSVIVLIMKGSTGQKIKPWMKNLSYYGAMKKLKPKEINDFIHKAIDLGYLEDHDIGNCVRVVSCTKQGLDFGQEYEEKLGKMIDDKDESISELVLD